MIERLLVLSGLLAATASPVPGGGLARDRQAILAQCGCFEVTYTYVETEAVEPGYPLRAKKQVKGLEWVEADVVGDRSVSLQHLLIGPQGALKHWRQVWDYEPRALLRYRGDGLWERQAVNPEQAAGRWAQRVYEVDDSPRYEGIGSWTHQGASSWESEAWSPLPRREFTQRSDYNVLVRRNRHVLTAEGWNHEQRNLKLKVSGATETPLVRETGLNAYRRVDDARCAPARQYWRENRATWHRIQGVWRDLIAASPRLRLARERDGVPLWQRLFELAARKPKDLEAEVRRAIADYREP